MSIREGFVMLPRSLFNDANWRGMREKYRRVFVVLLFHTSFTKKSFGIGSNIISIDPGQFCTSIRNLVDLCNDGIKYKDDKVDKNIVERAVSLFTKIGLVRQEVRHGKSILTITQKDLYDHFKRPTETVLETRPRLDRDTNEERKERKEPFVKKETNKERSAPVVVKSSVRDSSLSKKRMEGRETLWTLIEHYGLRISQTTLDVWVVKYDPEDIGAHINLLLNAKNVRNHESWMEKALKCDYARKEDLEELNKAFAEEFKSNHSWEKLTITKKYCKIEGMAKEIYFSLPKQQFESMMNENYEIFN